MNQKKLIKETISILDEFENRYKHDSVKSAENYLEYVEFAEKKDKADEMTLINPLLFPAFLDSILGFSRIDYVPEERNSQNMAPDFTPIDTELHPFIFETKGNDSDLEDFLEEFENKSKLYLKANSDLKYAIITNMRELAVYSEDQERKIEDYSFSFKKIYQDSKNKGCVNTNDENVQSLIRFVKKFKKKKLKTKEKIEAIAEAEPYAPLFEEAPEDYETQQLIKSIKFVVEELQDNVKNDLGSDYILGKLRNKPDRREQIAREIYSICQDIDNEFSLPDTENIDSSDLKKIFSSPNSTIEKARELYFYRVAYFTMSRMLLIRVWEDAEFIEKEYDSLYNGGFKKWYKNYNEEIKRVLEHAYNVGKEKYEWLFTEQNNYAWYTPQEKVLVDVLYEMAKYNLSAVSRDVLGTVYEEYINKQDKKNKGQYYTPHQIVSLIWDRLEYTSYKYGDEEAFFDHEDGERKPKLIFDPATGSGGFLVEAINRIRKYFQFHEESKEDLLDAKEAVIQGVYGSEISAFSYYLTEVNVLIQLTPIIQKIIELNGMERELSGNFTLNLLHQDSLALHEPPTKLVEKDPDEDFTIDKDHDILKLEGEKLEVFKRIKEDVKFDYVAANPPYIGEDNNKELFRNTLNKYPYWERHYQGRMDYLYFFIILGLQKLKEGGKLGFITTSYWLTADGGNKLRKYILNNAKINEIIDFGKLKLFEHAKGQHNMVFVLEKCSDGETRQNNRIKVSKIKKKFNGKNVNKRLTKLTKHVKKHIDKEDFSDPHIEVFTSAVPQGELNKEAWNLFYREEEKKILDKTEKKGEKLTHITHIKQGLIANPIRVDQRVLNKLNSDDIQKYDIQKKDGVFILSDKEIDNLNLSEDEKEIIRPFYWPSDITRYNIPDDTKYNVIYTTKETNIDEYPKIKKHLEKFKPKLSSRRECKQGKIPWYSLHWSRSKDIFENEKIVCPYRAKRNVFSYTEKTFYGEGSIRFITNKKNKEQLSNSNESLDLKYILGILNSSLLRVWVHHKTKPKGDTRELYVTPLQNIPIKPIDFDNEYEVEKYERIISNVEKILDLKDKLSKMSDYFSESIVELEKPVELHDVDSSKIIASLEEKNKRKIPNHSKITITNFNEPFILDKIKDISRSVDSKNMDYSLVLQGKNKDVLRIEGERNLLTLLQKILEGYQDRSLDEIKEEVILPKNFESYKKKKSDILEKTTDILKEIESLQKDINQMVCDLYDIDIKDVDRAIDNLF